MGRGLELKKFPPKSPLTFDLSLSVLSSLLLNTLVSLKKKGGGKCCGGLDFPLDYHPRLRHHRVCVLKNLVHFCVEREISKRETETWNHG